MNTRKRVRDLGIIIGSLDTGVLNRISDVEGVTVGHRTLVFGEGKLVPGKGPVRTGVTVIMPHQGNVWKDRPSAAWSTINGCGELTGAVEMEEFGALETPLGLTNTMCVHNVANGLIEHVLQKNANAGISESTVVPVVSECDDSFLNDSRGLHVRSEHVGEAIDSATERFELGNVGAGAGTTTFQFKGGIGSSSRVLNYSGHKWTLGVLVLSNFGRRSQLTIAGKSIGSLLKPAAGALSREGGSIVTVMATDAPLSSRQLKRLSRRAFLGIARTGSFSSNGSGDISVAFSTSNRIDYSSAGEKNDVRRYEEISEENMNLLFRAAVEATEESVLDSMFCATTVVGRDGNIAEEIPADQVLKILNGND
jgi:D-aminopeptidase